MKTLYIDTANISEIKEAHEQLGLIRGITTNPTLISREDNKLQSLEDIYQVLYLYSVQNNLSLSIEPVGTNLEEQTIKLNRKYFPVTVKLPVTELSIIKKLTSSGIQINCTCCFSETQMQAGAIVGSKYVSLFFNRLKDYGGDPLSVLEKTRTFIDNNRYNSITKIIAGSIRTSQDISDAWSAGADIVTCSLSVMKCMLQHPKTDESVLNFSKDLEKWLKIN